MTGLRPKNRLDHTFFEQTTVNVAKNLLGCILVTKLPGGVCAGKIVETEAYLSSNDPGCHSFRGKTKRNEAMFEAPGRSYVYLCYGMYQLFNVVTAPRGVGEAVLIRALEPVMGIGLMMRRRKIENSKNLCNGPGKLVLALGISAKHNNISLFRGPIALYDARSIGDMPQIKKRDIVTTTRIGLKAGADLPLRFYLQNSECVSQR